MSQVTNIVLSFSWYDAEAGALEDVNAFFGADGRGGFVSCTDPALPWRWYGGTKVLEAEVYVGAFSHLGLEDLVAHLRALDWEEPRAVQLLVKSEEDERFTLINVLD